MADDPVAAPGRIVVFNGGSSAGKTTLARSVQGALTGDWLLFGIDALLWSFPVRLFVDEDGIVFAPGGTVTRGDRFLALHERWMRALASLARDGADLLIDEVFVGGAADQRRWQQAFGDLDVCWIGVRCAADLAEAREAARGDRTIGMARRHAATVHEGVRYDVEVDAGVLDSATATSIVVEVVARRWPERGAPPMPELPTSPVASARPDLDGRVRTPWES